MQSNLLLTTTTLKVEENSRTFQDCANPAYERDGGACRFALGYKLQVLVSLRVF